MDNNELRKIREYLFRNTNTKNCALELLTTIRNRQRKGNPMEDSKWSQWIEKHGFGQGTYSNVKGTLEDNGLIVKDKGCFYLSSQFLTNQIKEWHSFLTAG